MVHPGYTALVSDGVEQIQQQLRAAFAATVARLEPAEHTARALGTVQLSGRPLTLVAAGKAAEAMSAGAMRVLDARGIAVRAGVVIGRASQPGEGDEARAALPPPLGFVPSSHPRADARSLAAARTALRLVREAGEGEVLALISGGSSALLALPAPGLELSEKNAVIAALAAGGADIHALNTVRKHLSAIKGGRLAAASSRRTTTLLVSDVVGGGLGDIGGGPTLPDPTGMRDACDVMAEAVGRGVWPWRVRSYVDAVLAGEQPSTPKRGRSSDRVALLAGPDALVDTAVQIAADSGLNARVFARDMLGAAEEVAQRVAAYAHRVAAAQPGQGLCFVGGGEAAVAVREDAGAGGRAQHLALLLARELRGIGGVTVLVAASDGIDGNTDAAGAIIDGHTWDLALSRGVDPARALLACDSHAALSAAEATVNTGPTEIHHGDLILILAA